MLRSKPTADTCFWFFVFFSCKRGSSSSQNAACATVGQIGYQQSTALLDLGQWCRMDQEFSTGWCCDLTVPIFGNQHFPWMLLRGGLKKMWLWGKFLENRRNLFLSWKEKKTDKNPGIQSGLIFNDLLPQGHINEFASCVTETRWVKSSFQPCFQDRGRGRHKRHLKCLIWKNAESKWSCLLPTARLPWKQERQLGWVHFQELYKLWLGSSPRISISPPSCTFGLTPLTASDFNPCTRALEKMLIISVLHRGFVARYFSVLLKTFLLHFFICSSFQTQQKAIRGREDPPAFLWVVGEVSISHETVNKTDTGLMFLCKMLGGISRLQMDISWWWNIFNRGLKHQGSHCCGWESRHTVN